MEIENIVNEIWPKIKKVFYYPSIIPPEITAEVSNGAALLDSSQVKINPEYLQKFKEKGITYKESLDEILTHEMTHLMRYPGSVLNILNLYKVTKNVTGDKDSADYLRSVFNEVQTNLYLLRRFNHLKTSEMRKIIFTGSENTDNTINKLINGLYQEVSGRDFGIESFSSEEKNMIEQLKKIEFLKKIYEKDSIKNFAEILKDHPDLKNNKSSLDLGLGMFGRKEILDGIKSFAKNIGDPKEFSEIISDMISSREDKSKRIKAGTGRAQAEVVSTIYTALAEGISIPIKKMVSKKNGGLYPSSHDSFELGDSLLDIDPFSSKGIMPGITKKWVRKEGNYYSFNENSPDSLILIDNSGSMPNPDNVVSIPVLGGTVFINSYLSSNSKVAIYNFGGDDHYTHFSSNKKLLHEEIRRYSGGGTVFNPRFIEEVLRNKEKSYDISVISDMEISNLNTFVETILSMPKTHRIHLFYTAESDENLRRYFGGNENIAIMPLMTKKDIEKITLGELNKSIF